jgi:F-type H+-transporting ATPase subunit delta
MAESVTLARPYAEAVFELARDENKLGAWEQSLERMGRIAGDASVQSVVGDPKIGADRLNQFFIDLSGDLSQTQKNFVRTLVDSERLLVLPEIHQLFVGLKNRHEGVKQVHITSAFPLDDAALKQLMATLEPRFKGKLEATVSVDPELIGGVRIAVGDEVIDASVRGKLATMAAALKA